MTRQRIRTKTFTLLRMELFDKSGRFKKIDKFPDVGYTLMDTDRDVVTVEKEIRKHIRIFLVWINTCQ